MARPQSKVRLGDVGAMFAELNVKKMSVSKATGISRATVYRLIETEHATQEICLQVIDYLLKNFGSKGLHVVRLYIDPQYQKEFAIENYGINEQKITSLFFEVKNLEQKIRDMSFRSLDDDQILQLRAIARRLDRMGRDLEFKYNDQPNIHYSDVSPDLPDRRSND